MLALPSAAWAAGVPSDPEARWHVLHLPLRRSIGESFAAVLGGDGAALGAVYARLFMWDLDLRRDLHPRDQLAVAYRRAPDGGFEIGAARYASAKHARTYEAFPFTFPGDDNPTFLDGAGIEVPRRLRDGPLPRYEQITALLKDRPTHAGMDFKTPAGTPVVAARAGRVTRTNWRKAVNGGCLELHLEDGTVAKYLHLDRVEVAPGARVRPGQIVARTGNTGRSTAPHLHYQLERGGRVLDPIRYHGTLRRRLPAAARRAFAASMAQWRRRLDAGAAARLSRLKPR